jgi:hypothetical protein
LLINPVFRSLHARGEVVVRAIEFWHRHFAKVKVTESSIESHRNSSSSNFHRSNKCPSRFNQWNLDASDVDRPVFATVYAEDLQAVVEGLKTGTITGESAAQRLEEMQHGLDIPLIQRRPLPDTLPSDLAICRGLVGLVLLGSAPAAMTLKDSKRMKIPAPVVSSSDRIMISKKRLVTVLHWLGLLDDEGEGELLQSMIHQLWSEAKGHSDAIAGFDLLLAECGDKVTINPSANVETHDTVDEVALGSLKWSLYGIADSQRNCITRWCMPCSPPSPHISHPIDTSRMQVHSGELVRHDPLSCPACIGATGRVVDELEAEGQLSAGSSSERPILLKRSVTSVPYDEELSSVEVTHSVLDSFLREG